MTNSELTNLMNSIGTKLMGLLTNEIQKEYINKTKKENLADEDLVYLNLNVLSSLVVVSLNHLEEFVDYDFDSLMSNFLDLILRHTNEIKNTKPNMPHLRIVN